MQRILMLLIVSLLVVVTGCSGSNTSNSDEKNDRNDLKIVELTIEKVDDSNFEVVTTAEGKQLEYAYYVYKDDEVLEKFSYDKNAHFSYSANEPGIYKVKSYIKDQDGNKLSQYTEEIEIE